MREVQIRRREAKSHLPAEVVANSIKVLGSHFVGNAPLKGLHTKEEQQILANHLDMDVDSKEFSKKSREFWIDLRVRVPSEGVVLNITQRSDGTPMNAMDYMIYKWAQRHKLVAKTKDELLSNSAKQFYIYDPEVESKRQNTKVKEKRAAYKEFIKITDSTDSVNKLKMILKVISDVDVNQMSDVQIENYCETLIEDKPNSFTAVATDKKLEVKAFIASLISNEVLNKYGNTIYFIEQKLGDTIDEAVLFLEDKKNSEILITLKAKQQELARK